MTLDHDTTFALGFVATDYASLLTIEEDDLDEVLSIEALLAELELEGLWS